MALQHLRLNICLRPQRLEELVLGHQSPGMLDEIPQHGKRLGCEKKALLSQAITTPEALVDGVEPEGRKRSHRSTNRGEERSCGDEIVRSEPLGEPVADRARTSLGRAERATRLCSPPSQRAVLIIC